MVFITLTDPERQALKRLSRQAVGRVALRAQMVLLSDRGYAVAQIAQIHACGGEVVGSSRVDLQACKLEYSIVSPK